MFPEFKCEHIADIDFHGFYSPALGGPEAATQFFSAIENVPLPLRTTIKSLLHQVARMVWIGDRIEELARGRPAFQVMFYLIAAELAAKTRFSFSGRGQSRKYVHRFFDEMCSDVHRTTLGQAFAALGGPNLDAREAVDRLYDMRCDVVHMGTYYTQALEHSGYKLLADTSGDGVTVHFTVNDLRQIILEGTIGGSRRLMP